MWSMWSVTCPMSIMPDAQPRLGWRIVRSLWLIGPLVGFGCLGGASFIYIGLRARRPAWWISGVAYLGLSIAAVSLIDRGEQTTTRGTVAVWVLIAAWLVSIVHAGLVNPAWLQWQATHGGILSLPRMVQLPGPAPSTSTAPLPGIVPDPAEFYAPSDRPPTSSAGPLPDPHPLGSAGPVDVNTASAEQLATLPGLDLARAQRVVALREARRGFASVNEFASAAELAPHEFVHTQRLVVCIPRPHQGSLGRVLDV
jgi:helix-hairpin-helix protein